MKSNKQKPVSISKAVGTLLVHSIFSTIQGEGPYVGQPCTFVRLAGCNLRCTFCDTEYTKDAKEMSISDVALKVALLRRVAGRHTVHLSPLVVITGGEPLRQFAVAFLVDELRRSGFKVQIETNGAYTLSNAAKATIVVSPKLFAVHVELLPHITAYKYVIDADHVSEEDGLPTNILGGYGKPARPYDGFDGRVYLNPLDTGVPEENARNLQAAVASCLRYGYTLGVQLHKLANLP